MARPGKPRHDDLNIEALTDWLKIAIQVVRRVFDFFTQTL
jgi:hypothetical protein